MYKRFRDSIVSPEQIINFRKDSIFRVLLLLLVYALLMTLPMIIDVVKFDQISLEQYNIIQEKLHDQSFDCEIANNELLCDTDTSVLLIDNFNNINVYIVSGDQIDYSLYDVNITNVIVYEDKIHVMVGGVKATESLHIFNGSLDQIDFRTIETDFDAFSHSVIKGLETFTTQTKGYWGSIVVATYILVNFVVTLFLSLFTAFIIKMRFKVIPFKQTFRLGSYVSSVSFIALVFMNLTGQQFFFLMVILFANSRQMGRLMTAINQVIKK